jgi:hypothetical protein
MPAQLPSLSLTARLGESLSLLHSLLPARPGQVPHLRVVDLVRGRARGSDPVTVTITVTVLRPVGVNAKLSETVPVTVRGSASESQAPRFSHLNSAYCTGPARHRDSLMRLRSDSPSLVADRGDTDVNNQNEPPVVPDECGLARTMTRTQQPGWAGQLGGTRRAARSAGQRARRRGGAGPGQRARSWRRAATRGGARTVWCGYARPPIPSTTPAPGPAPTAPPAASCAARSRSACRARGRGASVGTGGPAGLRGPVRAGREEWGCGWPSLSGRRVRVRLEEKSEKLRHEEKSEAAA